MQQMMEAVSQQYDKAYYKAQALFDEYDPCQHVVHSCGGLTCVAKSHPGPLCCPDCRHHSDTGCTVMCLGCKVSLCFHAGDHIEFRDKLWAIQQSLPYHNYSTLLRIRQPKEEVMKEAMWNIRQMLLWTPKRRMAWYALNVRGM